jgi:hypothetical protein
MEECDVRAVYVCRKAHACVCSACTNKNGAYVRLRAGRICDVVMHECVYINFVMKSSGAPAGVPV